MALRYAVIDGCPCPKPLYPILRKLQKETGCTYNSIYRGDDVRAILKAHGKHTQRELFETLPAGQANPPDRGTHILLGDGVVGALHEKLPWGECGIDVNDSDVPKVIAAAKRHGWEMYQPYPTGVEFHHLNFRVKPKRWKAFFRNVFGGGKAKAPKHAVADAKPAPAPRPSRNKRAADRLGGAIDVSEAQGDVDWRKVARKRRVGLRRRRQVKVAFCKATEGVTFTDGRFSGSRLDAMQAAGLRTGVYHFARPDNNTPAAEAAHFVRTVEAAGARFISYADWKAGKQGVLGVLDFETEPFEKAWAAGFARKFADLTGVNPLLYGYGSSLNPILGALPHFAGIWFAAYVDDWHPFLDGDDDKVVFWQNRDDWHCAGVTGNVDHSTYLG